MTLSDKRVDTLNGYKYPEEDVREFLKELKKSFKYDTFYQKVCFNIDKLAGDKLI